MDNLLQLLPPDKKPHGWLIVRFLIGFALFTLIYIGAAKMVLDQPQPGCYQIGIRGVIEASMFPVWLLSGFNVSRGSIFHRLILYGVSSVPYAIPWGLIASGSKLGAFIAIVLASSFFVLSFLLWLLFVGQMCA
jgi:hypothetical protein